MFHQNEAQLDKFEYYVFIAIFTLDNNSRYLIFSESINIFVGTGNF